MRETKRESCKEKRGKLYDVSYYILHYFRIKLDETKNTVCEGYNDTIKWKIFIVRERERKQKKFFFPYILGLLLSLQGKSFVQDIKREGNDKKKKGENC